MKHDNSFLETNVSIVYPQKVSPLCLVDSGAGQSCTDPVQYKLESNGIMCNNPATKILRPCLVMYMPVSKHDGIKAKKVFSVRLKQKHWFKKCVTLARTRFTTGMTKKDDVVPDR